MTTNKTFADIYKEQSARPTPLERFIKDMSVVALASKSAVKSWANGQTPTRWRQEAIAEHFGTTTEVLFPSDNEQRKEAQE